MCVCVCVMEVFAPIFDYTLEPIRYFWKFSWNRGESIYMTRGVERKEGHHIYRSHSNPITQASRAPRVPVRVHDGRLERDASSSPKSSDSHITCSACMMYLFKPPSTHHNIHVYFLAVRATLARYCPVVKSYTLTHTHRKVVVDIYGLIWNIGPKDAVRVQTAAVCYFFCVHAVQSYIWYELLSSRSIALT